MRTFPFTQDTTQTLVLLVTITRGLSVLRFTSYQESITIGGVTWSPAPGLRFTNLHFSGDGAPDSCDLNIASVASGIVAVGDASMGALDGWPIKIELADPATLTKTDLIPNATISHVTELTNRLNIISVVGPLAQTLRPLTEHYSPTGRETLGDDRCKIPIRPADIGRGISFVTKTTTGYTTGGYASGAANGGGAGFADSGGTSLVTLTATGLMHVNDAYGRFRANKTSPDVDAVEDYANVYYECTTAGTTDASTAPSYPTTPGATVTDGTVVFTARNSWLRYCRGYAEDIYTIKLNALPDSRASDATWYELGGLYVCSGSLKDMVVLPIKTWDPANYRITLFTPILDAVARLPANTQFEIYPGCDLTREMCYSRFNNIVNLRAETFVPPANPLIGQSQGQGY